MRVHIYSQELTRETSLVSKQADTGINYFGVRMTLASPSVLHCTPEDDDRSAVTFWIPNAKSFTPEDLAQVFEEMARLVRTTDPDVT